MSQHVISTARPIRLGIAIRHPRDIGAIALGFAVMVACVPWALGGDYVTRWGAIAVGVPLVFPLSYKGPFTILLCLLAGLAWAAWRTAYSPDPLGGYLELFYLAVLCLTFIVASSLASIDTILLGAAVGVAISAILAIPQYFGWTGIFQVSVPAGLFFSSEVLAECASPLFVWCVAKRYWWLAGLLLIPIILCHSRVGMFSAGLGLLYVFHRSRANTAVILLLLGFASLVALVSFGPSKFNDAGIRVVLWATTAISITPLGHGLGWFYAAHPIEQFAHSDILQAAAELGVGSLFFLVPAGFALTRRNVDGAERAIFIALFAEAIVSFPLHMPATGFLAALLAGHLMCNRNAVSLGSVEREYDDDKNHQRAFAARTGFDAFGSRRISVSLRSIFAGREENRLGTTREVRT